MDFIVNHFCGVILRLNSSVYASQVADDSKLILQAVKVESNEARSEFVSQVFKDSSAVPLLSHKQTGLPDNSRQLWSKPDSDKYHQCIDRPSGYKRKCTQSNMKGVLNFEECHFCCQPACAL